MQPGNQRSVEGLDPNTLQQIENQRKRKQQQALQETQMQNQALDKAQKFEQNAQVAEQAAQQSRQAANEIQSDVQRLESIKSQQHEIDQNSSIARIASEKAPELQATLVQAAGGRVEDLDSEVQRSFQEFQEFLTGRLQSNEKRRAEIQRKLEGEKEFSSKERLALGMVALLPLIIGAAKGKPLQGLAAGAAAAGKLADLKLKNQEELKREEQFLLNQDLELSKTGLGLAVQKFNLGLQSEKLKDAKEKGDLDAIEKQFNIRNKALSGKKAELEVEKLTNEIRKASEKELKGITVHEDFETANPEVLKSINKEEASKFRTAVAAMEMTQWQYDQVEKLVEGWSTLDKTRAILGDPTKKARLERWLSGILLKEKDFFGLGALQEGELKLMLKFIGDPTQWRNLVAKKELILNLIQDRRGSIGKDIGFRAKSLGLKPKEGFLDGSRDSQDPNQTSEPQDLEITSQEQASQAPVGSVVIYQGKRYKKVDEETLEEIE